MEEIMCENLDARSRTEGFVGSFWSSKEPKPGDQPDNVEAGEVIRIPEVDKSEEKAEETEEPFTGNVCESENGFEHSFFSVDSRSNCFLSLERNLSNSDQFQSSIHAANSDDQKFESVEYEDADNRIPETKYRGYRNAAVHNIDVSSSCSLAESQARGYNSTVVPSIHPEDPVASSRDSSSRFAGNTPRAITRMTDDSPNEDSLIQLQQEDDKMSEWVANLLSTDYNPVVSSPINEERRDDVEVRKKVDVATSKSTINKIPTSEQCLAIKGSLNEGRSSENLTKRQSDEFVKPKTKSEMGKVVDPKGTTRSKTSAGTPKAKKVVAKTKQNKNKLSGSINSKFKFNFGDNISVDPTSPRRPKMRSLFSKPKARATTPAAKLKSPRMRSSRGKRFRDYQSIERSFEKLNLAYNSSYNDFYRKGIRSRRNDRPSRQMPFSARSKKHFYFPWCDSYSPPRYDYPPRYHSYPPRYDSYPSNYGPYPSKWDSYLAAESERFLPPRCESYPEPVSNKNGHLVDLMARNRELEAIEQEFRKRYPILEEPVSNTAPYPDIDLDERIRNLFSTPNGDSLFHNGMMFICNAKSEIECFGRMIFGLPSSSLANMRNITPRTAIFMYRIDPFDPVLHGVFTAVAPSALNIDQTAFAGRFPAQIRVRNYFRFPNPLPESILRTILPDSNRLRMLNRQQTEAIIQEFYNRRFDAPLPPKMDRKSKDFKYRSHGHKPPSFQRLSDMEKNMVNWQALKRMTRKSKDDSMRMSLVEQRLSQKWIYG